MWSERRCRLQKPHRCRLRTVNASKCIQIANFRCSPWARLDPQYAWSLSVDVRKVLTARRKMGGQIIRREQRIRWRIRKRGILISSRTRGNRIENADSESASFVAKDGRRKTQKAIVRARARCPRHFSARDFLENRVQFYYQPQQRSHRYPIDFRDDIFFGYSWLLFSISFGEILTANNRP